MQGRMLVQVRSRRLCERWVYRIWQALVGLRPRVTDADRAEARAWLDDRQFALWAQQAGRDQAHTLRVFRLVRAQGYGARPLLQAALLHDVGKVVGSPRLWHRTVWVLVGALAPRWRHILVAERGWRRAFWALAEHPHLGAEMARRAGCDEDVVWLIAHHQDENVEEHSERARWLEVLKKADRQA